MATPGEPTPPPVQLQPGQQPTQEQIEAIQAHMRADAERLGLTWEQYVTKLREMAMRQQQAMMQQQQQQMAAQQGGHVHGPNCNHGPNGHSHGPPQGQMQVPPGGPPKPEAMAMANFLRGQNLKLRTCVFNEKKADMFRVKRALRVLEGDAYKKARSKNPLLPEVKDRASAEAAFKLLPMSLLALRVEKIEPESDEEDERKDGDSKAKKQKKKRIKGQWTVQIVQQQDTQDDMYYMWLYDGPAWKQQAKALAALAAVMTIILFPLWPLKLRQGAWYLSMAFFGFIVCFFVMAIFRLILFLITMFTHPPGLWLFPNLFEDVGFVESFIPLWAWQMDKKTARKEKRLEREKKAAAKAEKIAKVGVQANGSAADVPVTTVGSIDDKVVASGIDAADEPVGQVAHRKPMHAMVEEADDE